MATLEGSGRGKRQKEEKGRSQEGVLWTVVRGEVDRGRGGRSSKVDQSEMKTEPRSKPGQPTHPDRDSDQQRYRYPGWSWIRIW